jgi:hypothetical protein
METEKVAVQKTRDHSHNGRVCGQLHSSDATLVRVLLYLQTRDTGDRTAKEKCMLWACRWPQRASLGPV